MRHDVPGAKLVHENVADHSSVQLQRWLKCRGLKNSGLKPELVKRKKMITQQNRDELEEKGYTVVPDVIDISECDELVTSYRQWLDTFSEGTWPQTKFSLIQRYRIGHREPTWKARIKAYPVFSQLWHTEKLLTSMDAVSIGRPPEDGEEEFWTPNQTWLHCDQSADREGLHAYQGAVYLEHCDKDDWTFEVVEGSHKHFEDFMLTLQKIRCTKVSEDNLAWLAERGCVRKRVPCPKGGMVLWDSRLLHANTRPVKGRANPGRWRFVVFVCMAPAAWATPEDVQLKVKAYNNLDLTGHWPCTEIIVFSSKLKDGSVEESSPLEKLPEVATSDMVKRLVGVVPYEEDGDESAPQYTPKFNKEKWTKLLTTSSHEKGPVLD